MNNGVKSVISAVSTLRTLPRVWNLSRNAVSSNWLQTTASTGFRYRSRRKESIASFSNPKSEENLDRAVLPWSSIEEVFQYIDISSDMKDPNNLINIMKNIMTLLKIQGLDVENIKKRGEFIKLCQIIQKSLPKFSESQTLVMLTFLNKTKIPSTAMISQLCFESMRKNINHFSLKEICILQQLLKEREKTELTKALFKALPLAMDTQLPKQLDTEDLEEMTTLLNYATTYSKNSETIETLLNAIQNYGELTPRTCYAVLRTFAECSKVSGQHDQLICSCLEYVCQNANKFFFPHLMNLLYYFTIQDSPLYKFYHEAFWDTCGSVIIDKDHGIKVALVFLKYCSKRNHTHIPMLDYVAAKCFDDPNAISKQLPTLVALYIGELAKADYKPVFWDTIQENVITSSRRVESLEQYSLVRHATYLLTLDYYCPKLIARAFTEPSRHQISRDERGRAILHQIVKTLYPSYTGPWPDCNIKQSKTFKLEKALKASLECALGGAQYVKSNMRTKTGCIIDFVVVLRKGGYPVAINTKECSESNSNTSSESNSCTSIESSSNTSIESNSNTSIESNSNASIESNSYTSSESNSNTSIEESTMDTEESLQKDDEEIYVEDMETPPESQILLILQLHHFAYPNNMNRLRGFLSLLHKSLEAMGDRYSVVPINVIKWSTMPDREKVPYLMEAIRLKCDEMSYTPHVN